MDYNICDACKAQNLYKDHHKWRLYEKNIWEYDFLNGFLGSNVHVTMADVDGIVSHENSSFLIFEHKASLQTKIKMGQGMQFERMLRTGLFTIVVIYGKPQQPFAMQVFYENGQIGPLQNADIGTIQQFAARWFAFQDAKKVNYGLDSVNWINRLKTAPTPTHTPPK